MRKCRLLLPVLSVGAWFVFTPSTASAAPIVTVVSGSLAVTAVFTGTPSYDIRGAALVSLSDTGVSPTTLAIFDTTGGTDPGATTLPFGNTALIVNDSNSGTSGIEDILVFDFTHLLSPTPTSIIVPATALVFPVGSTLGPALADLVTSSPVPFYFDLSGSAGLPNGGEILQFSLASTPAPEPASFLLLGGCVLGFALARRFCA